MADYSASSDENSSEDIYGDFSHSRGLDDDLNATGYERTFIMNEFDTSHVPDSVFNPL